MPASKMDAQREEQAGCTNGNVVNVHSQKEVRGPLLGQVKHSKTQGPTGSAAATFHELLKKLHPKVVNNSRDPWGVR